MKAKLALLEASSSTSQNPKTCQSKNKGLIAESFDWDEEEFSDNEELTQVKVLMALADDELTVGKKHTRNGEWIDISIRKVNILLSMDEDADWQNYLKYINVDLKYDLLVLKEAKLEAVTFQIQKTKLTKLNHALQEQLKEERKINKKWLTSSIKEASPSSEVMSLTYHPHSPKGPVTISVTKPIISSVPTEVKDTEHESKINELTKLVQMLIDEKINSKTHEQKFKSSNSGSSSKILKATAKPFSPCTHCGFYDHRPDDCRNYPECEICGSYDHFTSGHNRVILRHIREPIWYMDSGCSRSMTGVKSYLHKYVEQLGPKVVFGDNSSCITEGYGSINYGGTIFNANKEIVLIAHRRNDVYVLDMSSLTPNGAGFFVKSSESVNWLWHKRLSHLNFKNINKLSKQNKVLGLPSLVYSKDKPCSACEKGKHKRASFKTKQNFSIRKCLHLLYMELFGPVSPMYVNHEKYTLVIVDEYSRMVENQRDVNVKQIRTDNGIEFQNSELESFCDEKGISQNFSFPYTPKRYGISKRKNRTLIENRSIIVKRHDRTPYEIFKERIHDINYFHVFGYPVFIHSHKDHLDKFDTKSDDRYFLGYSFNSKAFRVFNGRRQQIEETCHVTFDESIEAIRFTNTPVDEISINDSSRYPPDEFLHEDDLSRQYQSNSDISYYTIPHDRSLTELTQEKHFLEDPQGTLLWLKDQHIELVNIIGDPGEDMLTRSMVAKLIAASASKCLFVDFLSEIEPKKSWTLVPLPYGKIAIGSKWVFRNKKYDELGIVTKNKARLVAQGYIVGKKELTMMKPLHHAFLNGKPKEEVYVKQPPCFESSEFSEYVCKLDKALYGLKQAPREWYLKITPSFGLWYLKRSGFDLKGYSNSDYTGCNMDKKSTSGSCQILGGKLVCWSAKKQQSVAMSSAEAEYVVAAGCCENILWMKIQLSDYDIHYKMVPIFYDNTSAIAISDNPVLHSRTKHIDIRYHFIRDYNLKGDIELHFIPTEYQLADIFTKPMNEPTFTRLKAEKPLTFGFKTFTESTGLNYYNGTYVSHPSPETVKALAKIIMNPILLDMTPVLKTAFPVAWRILFTFGIQVLGGNYSSTEQTNSIQQLLAYYLLTGIKVDILKIIYSDLVTSITKKSRKKYVSYPRFIGCTLEVLLGTSYTQNENFRIPPTILSNSNFYKNPSKVTPIKLTASMIVVNNYGTSVSPLPFIVKKKKKKPQTVTPTLPKS
ncbi:retrovirus-related pol polyprotein from transposon TNT 1-94 [Tanacetum coccineum]